MDTNVFAGAEASALIKVEKADGRIMYYRVANNEHVEITQDEYIQEGGA